MLSSHPAPEVRPSLSNRVRTMLNKLSAWFWQETPTPLRSLELAVERKNPTEIKMAMGQCLVAGISPLHWAARHDHVAIMASLIEHGFANTEDTYLCLSVLQTTEDSIRTIKQHDIPDSNRTALQTAAAHGSHAVVAYLISKNANLEAKTDDEPNTPIHLAALAGHTRTVRLLMNAGAEPVQIGTALPPSSSNYLRRFPMCGNLPFFSRTSDIVPSSTMAGTQTNMQNRRKV